WEVEAVARHALYADCDEEGARAAFERLRPQARTPYAKPCPIGRLPPIPRTYVVCGEDRIVNPELSRRIARERLDADLVELPGGHSPFLSRPGELAAVLHEQSELAT
ncbi:MAG: alpha/beta hydrolase, partial [Solirubrobacteraceae bacterium]